MILVIGGYAAGKREWVKDHLGYTTDDFTDDAAHDAKVLFDLQDIDADLDVEELLAREVIVCDEVGCGLVPVDPKDRADRERTGRLCILLAQRASCVVRVICGIGTVIKGELPAGAKPEGV